MQAFRQLYLRFFPFRLDLQMECLDLHKFERGPSKDFSYDFFHLSRPSGKGEDVV